MNMIDITSLISYLKFGYEGNTIDLIYLLLIFRFILYPLIKWFILKLKKEVLN